MLMSQRPLFIDISSHQPLLNLSKAYDAGNDVLGVIMRAGNGYSKDADFENFDAGLFNWDEIWRGSYWALMPHYNVWTQYDKWHEVDPEGSLYMIDFERHGGKPPAEVAEALIKWSNEKLKRDGVRPWIYGGYYFLMDFLIPYTNAEWLNEHWFVLAQYDRGDGHEYESITLPDKIDIDRIAFKQTTSKMQLYPGSGNVDRCRFLLGDTDDLHDFMSIYTGVGIPEEPTEPTGDSDCEQRVTVLEESLAQLIVRYNEMVAGLMVTIGAMNEEDQNQKTLIRELQGLTGELRIGFRTHSSRQKHTLFTMAGKIKAIESHLDIDTKVPWYKRIKEWFR